MNTKISTLRPGLLVSLKTSVTGNVKYYKRTIENAKLDADGVQRAKWETERVIIDPVEDTTARQTRTQCRLAITRVCASSAFGLLCPEDRADELDKAIAEARKLADEFNGNAKLSRVGVYIISGRIAQDDVEAVKAINSEVRDLLADMEAGVKNLDVKTIRDAAAKARSVGMMLSPEAQTRLKMAIDAARETAKRIVAAGEQAAVEVDQRTLRQLAESRTMFLDLDTPQAQVTAPEAQARALDLAPSAPVKPVSATAPQFELIDDNYVKPATPAKPARPAFEME